MKLLLTGYPGFLARSIKAWFEQAGWNVDTLGLLELASDEKGSGEHIVCNLAEQVPALPEERYDLVIHAAGKAHVVPRTAEEAAAFFAVNVQGTANLLSALQETPPKAILFISSVAVYGLTSGEAVTEEAALLAEDPYGKSKIEAEKLILNTPFPEPVRRGIVRLPLIAGANAPGNLGSMFRAMRKGLYFNIGSGAARRSVILLRDIAPFLAELAGRGGVYNLTDGRDLSFAELYSGLRKLNHFPYRPGLPFWCAALLALTGEVIQKITRRQFMFNRRRLRQMTQTLTFDGRAALQDFSWRPHPVLDHLDELSSAEQN